jgi:dihydroorotase
MEPLLIENGRLVDPSQRLDRPGRLLITEGKIAAIDPLDGQLPPGCERIDARGGIIAPGLIDLGAELREPGREEDETIADGMRAAVVGGYTSILCAANTDPPIDTPGAVEFVRQKASKSRGARVHVIACLSKGRQGEEMAELGLLVEAGAVAFSDAPRPVSNSALMKRALEYCRMFDRPIFDRPEVPELARDGVMHDGRVSLLLGLAGLPTEAEDLAVARDLRLVEATSGRLHVGPVSTMGSIDLLRHVKTRGIPVTASVCPQNLAMSDEALRSFDASFKVKPPLRSPRHVQTLREALVEGTIDAIVSGHTPRAREKKMDDLDLAPFGMTSLETTLGVIITELIAPGLLSWCDAIQRMATAPARIAGIAGGTLQVGQAADVVVIDPAARWTVREDAFRSRSSNSPLIGQTLTGRATHTIVGGQVLYRLRPELTHLA